MLTDENGKYASFNFPSKRKSLQDHFKTMKENRDAVVAKQMTESGTVVEDREVDKVLDCIREDLKDCTDRLNEKKEQYKEAEDVENVGEF